MALLSWFMRDKIIWSKRISITSKEIFQLSWHHWDHHCAESSWHCWKNTAWVWVAEKARNRAVTSKGQVLGKTVEGICEHVFRIQIIPNLRVDSLQRWLQNDSKKFLKVRSRRLEEKVLFVLAWRWIFRNIPAVRATVGHRKYKVFQKIPIVKINVYSLKIDD